jgi:hypothetical protein
MIVQLQTLVLTTEAAISEKKEEQVMNLGLRVPLSLEN